MYPACCNCCCTRRCCMGEYLGGRPGFICSPPLCWRDRLSKLNLGSLTPRVFISWGGAVCRVYLRFLDTPSGCERSMDTIVLLLESSWKTYWSRSSSGSCLTAACAAAADFFSLRRRFRRRLLPGFLAPNSRFVWPPGGRPTFFFFLLVYATAGKYSKHVLYTPGNLSAKANILLLMSG